MRLIDARRADTDRGQRAFAAAGWLLAELTLVLMLVLMASYESPAQKSVKRVATAATHEPQREGLARSPVRIDGVVLDNPNDEAAARSLIRKIEASNDHRPGLILLFGVTYSSADPLAGQNVAGDMYTLLRRSGFIERWNVVVRPFLQVYGGDHTREGEIIADVYYYVRQS